jgi:hypothetical protein
LELWKIEIRKGFWNIIWVELIGVGRKDGGGGDGEFQNSGI